ncbi:MAG: ABC transporter ATP-binding protein [Clostridia bacterium]|nr:ABC transporter ATP-binding protein [Clostridia bacterium]
MKLLEVQKLGVRYGKLAILHDVDFSVGAGEWLMIVGPNGAGKSTIINAISQGVSYTGDIRFLGRDVKAYRPNALARRMGVLAQNHYVNYAFSVGEVARLGRYAHAPGMFARQGDDAGEEMVRRALQMTGMLDKSGQSLLTLSGGELQRAFLAQLLAQDPQLLLLDEPTNHLDLVYQRQTFALLSQWLGEKEGRAIVSVVHDLSLARAYGTRALLLAAGKKLAEGTVGEVFAPAHLEAAYAMDVYAWMREMLGQWR